MAYEAVRLVPMDTVTLRLLTDADLAAAGRRLGAEVPLSFLDLRAMWLLLLEQIALTPEAEPWLARAVVAEGRTAEGRAVVGHAGFHGPPDSDGVVEVAYGTVPERRGRGYATAALAELVRLAGGDPRVRALTAWVSPTNAASVAVLGRLGFRRAVGQEDPLVGHQDVAAGASLHLFRRDLRPAGEASGRAARPGRDPSDVSR